MKNKLEWFRMPEKLYFKKGCMPVALRELQEVYHKNRVLILAQDSAEPVTALLYEYGIFYTIMHIEETMESVQNILASAKRFEPDCVIAVGASAIVAGKLLCAMYENPELSPETLQKYSNVRDRSLPPLRHEQLYFVAIAADDCGGDEVSPFSLEIPETALGFQDYQFLPDMAIIDTDMIQAEDVQEIAELCSGAVCNCIVSFNAENMSDYAYGLSVRALQLIFAYFPEYQKKPDDMFVLERLSNAVTMAGMALSNVYDSTDKAFAEDTVLDFTPAGTALGMTPEELETKFTEILCIAYPEE